ncbi:hypothetical protein V6N11_081961 [Hibiscus sabdariffa]|uniref:Uncharacterized protein n=1 Tax=Hibiscus sabdariffa TaxID=183260 RepID=A0ABR2Q7M3_9ROSI
MGEGEGETQSFHAANLDHLETSTRDRTSTNASRCYLNFQIKIQRNLGVNVCGGGTRSTSGLLEILQVMRSEELIENRQSEVDLYLEERTKKLMKINRRKSFCRLFRKGRIPSGQSYHKLVKIEL